MESREHERRWVEEYMWTQARDETVEHAEKLAEERVFDRDYEVWDVHTDKGRWWVVTNPTNLYSQADFKSMDGVLTFHLGLMMRLSARQARKAPDNPEPRMQRTRRQWEQAAEALNRADEAEEFQGVGMQCRETLLSFVHGVASEALVPQGTERPKASDFVHWSEHIAAGAAPGPSGARLRGLLRAAARESWDFASWLTHAKNATFDDALIAVESTGMVLSLFERAISKQERGGPERCPACGSYRLVADSYFDDDLDRFVDVTLCEGCDWSEEFEPDRIHFTPDVAAVEDECLPSAEI